jgi:hypothetical protein
MYLEVLTIGHDVDEVFGPFNSQLKVFVGPFTSQEQRELFREHWERQLNSDKHNANQVKFLSQDELPEGWGPAMTPGQFRGFKRIVWDDIAGDFKEA